MKTPSLAIPDVILFEPKVFGDERGFFYDSFNQKAFEEATGLSPAFVQDNLAKSSKSVLRGFHYQLPPKAQGKLVRVVRGEVFDVAVATRQGMRGVYVGTIRA
jgi:dTDP-4-dehydrorhamnose 3,5-epimerase